MASNNTYFTGDYERYYNELGSSDGVKSKATSLRDEVGRLSSEFENVKYAFNYLSGQGMEILSSRSVDSIIEKFDTALSNIDESLIPATEAIVELYTNLKLMKEKETLLISKQEELESEKARNVPRVKYAGKTKTGRPITVHNPEYDVWINNMNRLETEIATLTVELDDIKTKCDECIAKVSTLESQIKEFSSFVGVTNTILFGGTGEGYDSLTLEEKLQQLASIISDYNGASDLLESVYEAAYGNGFTMTSEEYDNIHMLFDVFNIYELAGVKTGDFRLGRNDTSYSIDPKTMATLMEYCIANDVFTKIENYMNGQSWEESGIASLWADKSIKYDENSFKAGLRYDYKIKGDDIESYLKGQLSLFTNNSENILNSYTEYAALVEMLNVVDSKKYWLEQAKNLVVFEDEMNNEAFSSYLDKDYTDYTLIDQEYLKYLDKDEVALYAYLCENHSKEYADQYLMALEGTMAQRKGAYAAVEYVNKICEDGWQIYDPVTGAVTGAWDGIRGFCDGLIDLTRVHTTNAGEKTALDYELMYKVMLLQELNDADYEYLKQANLPQYVFDALENAQNLTETERIIVNQFYSTGQSVGNMAVPMIAAFVPVGGQALSTGLMSLSIAGNSAVEARQDGASLVQAYLYGAASAAAETSTEFLMGWAPGPDFSDSKNIFLKMASEMHGEGAEEFVNYGLDTVFSNVILGGDNEFVLKDALTSYGQGAISSVAMSGTNKLLQIGIDAGTTAVTGKSYAEVVLGIEGNRAIRSAISSSDNILATQLEGGTVTSGSISALNKSISNLTPVEALEVSKGWTSEEQSKLSGLLNDNAKNVLKNAEVISSASSTSLNDLNVSEIGTDTLNTVATRDGRTVAEYLVDTKTSADGDYRTFIENVVAEDRELGANLSDRVATIKEAQVNAVTGTNKVKALDLFVNAVNNTNENAIDAKVSTMTEVYGPVQQDNVVVEQSVVSDQVVTNVDSLTGLESEVEKALQDIKVSEIEAADIVKQPVIENNQQAQVKVDNLTELESEFVKEFEKVEPVVVDSDINRNISSTPLIDEVRTESVKDVVIGNNQQAQVQVEKIDNLTELESEFVKEIEKVEPVVVDSDTNKNISSNSFTETNSPVQPVAEEINQITEKPVIKVESVIPDTARATETVLLQDVSSDVITKVTATMNGTSSVDIDSSKSLNGIVSEVSGDVPSLVETTTTTDSLNEAASTLAVGGIGLGSMTQAYVVGSASKTNGVSAMDGNSSLDQTKTMGSVDTLYDSDNNRNVSKQEYIDNVDNQYVEEWNIPTMELTPDTSGTLINKKINELIESFDSVISGNTKLDNNYINEMLSILDEYQEHASEKIDSPDLFKEKISKLKVRISNLANQVDTFDNGTEEILSIKEKFEKIVNASSSATLLSMIDVDENINNNQVISKELEDPIVITPPFGDNSTKVEFRTKTDFDRFLSENSDNLRSAKTGADLINILEFIDRVDSLFEVNVGTTANRKSEIIISYVLNNKMNSEFLSTLSNNNQTIEMLTTILNESLVSNDLKVSIIEALSSDIRSEVLSSELINQEIKDILSKNSFDKTVILSSDNVSMLISNSLKEAKNVSTKEEFLSLLNSLSTKADSLELSQNEIDNIKEQVVQEIPVNKIFDFNSIMSLSSNKITDILKSRALDELPLSSKEKTEIIATIFDEDVLAFQISKLKGYEKVETITALSGDDVKVRVMEKVGCEDLYKVPIAFTFESDQLKVKYLNELNVDEELKVDLIKTISDDVLKIDLMEQHKISDGYKAEIISTLLSDKLKNKLLNENNFSLGSITEIVSSMSDGKLKIKLMNKYDLLIDEKIKIISTLSSDKMKLKQIKVLNLNERQQVPIIESFKSDKLKVDFLHEKYVSKSDKAKIIKSISDENTKYVETINHDITDPIDLINIFYGFKDDNLKVSLLKNRFLPYEEVVSLLPNISDESLRIITYFDVMGSYQNLSKYANDFLSSIKSDYIRRVVTDRMARSKISYDNLAYQKIIENVELEAKEMQSAYNKVNNNNEIIFDIQKIKEQMQDEFMRLKDSVPFEEVEIALNNIWNEAKYYADPNGELEAFIYEGWLSNVSRKDDSMYRFLNSSDASISSGYNDNYGVNQGYFRESTSQTKFIGGFIANKYKVSLSDAMRLIERIDYEGACSYTSRMNSIFMKYMDSPETFKSIFGFDMFVEDNGRKYFNYPQLLADIYVDANIKNFSDKKLFRKTLKSDLTLVDQVYNYDSDLSIFNNYFKHNKISLKFKNVTKITFDYNKFKFVMNTNGKNKAFKSFSIADFKSEFVNIVADKLMRGQEVTLSLNGNGSYITDSKTYKLSGNHSTTVTGITADKNSLIVSTWGQRAIVPIDDRFFKAFSIGVFDIVDTKNNAVFDPVESFKDYVFQYQNDIGNEVLISDALQIMDSIDSKASELGIGSEFCKKLKAELLSKIKIKEKDLDSLKKLPSNVNTDLIKVNILDSIYDKDGFDSDDYYRIIKTLSSDDMKISQMNKYLSGVEFYKAIVISHLSSKDKIIEEYNKLEMLDSKFEVARFTRIDQLILDVLDSSPYISEHNLACLLASVTSDQLKIDLMGKYKGEFAVAKVIASFASDSLKKDYLQSEISEIDQLEIIDILSSISNDPSNNQFKLDLLPLLKEQRFLDVSRMKARVLATLSREALITELPKYDIKVIVDTISYMDVSDSEKVNMYFEFIPDSKQKIGNSEKFLDSLKDEDSKKLFNNRLGEERLVLDYNDYLKTVKDNIDDLNSLSEKMGEPINLDFAKIKERMDEYFNDPDNRTFQKQFEFDNYLKELNAILDEEKASYIQIDELESMLYEARLRNLEKRDDDLLYLTNKVNNGNTQNYKDGYAENYGVNQGFFKYSGPIITRKIRSFISKKYNVNLDDAMRLLERIDYNGACSYTSRMNSIFTKYMNNPSKFKEIFGYDLYVKTKGRTHLNYPQMLADIYVDANLELFTIKTSDGNRNLKDNIKDTEQRTVFNDDLSIFNDYFKKNNIPLRFNNIEEVAYSSSSGEFRIFNDGGRKGEKKSISEFKQRFVDIIEENLKNNKEVILDLSGSGSYIMNSHTHKVRSGHSTIITGITSDRRNLIVSTWGNRGIVPIDDYFYKNARLGIFDIVDDPSMFDSIDNNIDNKSFDEFNNNDATTSSFYATQDIKVFDGFVESNKSALKQDSDPSKLLNILNEVDDRSLNENISSEEVQNIKKELISLIDVSNTSYLLDLPKNSNSDLIKLYALKNNEFKVADKREIIQSFSNIDSMIQGMKSAKIRQYTKADLIKNLPDDASKLKALENINLSNENAIKVIESLDSDDAKITAFDLTNLDTYHIALAISTLDNDDVKIEEFKNLTEVEEVSFYGTICVLDSIKTEEGQLKALETINLSVLEKVNILNTLSSEQERVDYYFNIFSDYPSRITGADMLLRRITDNDIKNSVIERLSNDKLDFEYSEYLKNVELKINDIKNLSNKIYKHSDIGIDFNKLKEEMDLEFNRLKDGSPLDQKHFSLFTKSLNNIWNSYVSDSSLLSELDSSLYEAWQRNISLRDDNITSFIEKDNYANNIDIKDGYSNDYGVNQGFFKECSDESKKRVSTFLANKYNIKTDLALRLMEKVDLIGACSYTSRINSIFMKYMDNPDKFKEMFGYDLYIEENGRKHFNYSQMLADIYIDANFKDSLSSDFNLMIRWYKDDVRCDSCLNLSIFNNYFKNNNIPLRFGNVEKVTYNSVDEIFKISDLNDSEIIHSKVSEFNEEFLIIVEDYLKAGKEVTLDLSIAAKYFVGDKVVKLNGDFGHSTIVTGITEDRSHLIVSTWGQRGLIPLDEAFYKDFQLGVFDIIDDPSQFNRLDALKISNADSSGRVNLSQSVNIDNTQSYEVFRTENSLNKKTENSNNSLEVNESSFASKETFQVIKDLEYGINQMMDKYNLSRDIALRSIALLIDEENFYRMTSNGNAREILRKYSFTTLKEAYNQLVSMESVDRVMEEEVKYCISKLQERFNISYKDAIKNMQALVDRKNYNFMTSNGNARTILMKYSFDQIAKIIDKIEYSNFVNSIASASQSTIVLGNNIYNSKFDFFELYGKSKDKNYGVDQGLVYNLFKFRDAYGREYDYREAMRIVKKAMENHEIIPHFRKIGTSEYFDLKDYVMDKYRFSQKDASIVLTCIDEKGACSYAAVCNTIFKFFENDPSGFEKAFGYPMYGENKIGDKVLNSKNLLVDLYVFANTTDNGGNLLVKDFFGNYSINKSMLSTKVDPLGRVLLNTSEQAYMSKSSGMNIAIIDKFLKSRQVSYNFNSVSVKDYHSSVDSKKINDIARRVLDGLKHNKHYILGIYSGDFAINMISSDPKLYSSVSTSNWSEGGGHAIFVTGVTNDSFVVSSWGKKYYIPFKDLVNGEWRLAENTIDKQ